MAKKAKDALAAGLVLGALKKAAESRDAGEPSPEGTREPKQLRRGKRAHREEPVRPGEEPEVRTPSGKKMDRYNSEERHIRELKTDNPRERRKGERKLERYKEEMEEETGKPHTTELTTYDPTEYEGEEE